MNVFQIKCNSESRKKLLQQNETINGIDYIEVRRVKNSITQNNNSGFNTDKGSDFSSLKRTSNSILLLLFLFKEPMIPNTIEKGNLIILGGTRIQNIGIELAGRPDDEILGKLNENEKEIINSVNSTKRKKLIVIKPTQEGDFSVYTLKLVADKEKPNETLPNFDPVFSQIDFSFKVDCALDFDCKIDKKCPPVNLKEPVLDYMAKDYASFVKLVLSRFGHIMPDWKERSAADLTNVLIELLSYVGDHLSYYQDAVSTEAYLGTAKKRISIRRHARLLDYFIHEGSNARTWVYFKVDGVVLKKLEKSIKVLTGGPIKDEFSPVVSEDDFDKIVSQNEAQVFETLHDVYLFSSHNEIHFYTWGETDCCLPKGATHATLLADYEVNDSLYHLDFHIFSWEAILNKKTHQEKLKNFIMKISSVFNDTNSINIIKIDNNTLKLVDRENSSRFISIKLSGVNATVTDNNGHPVYEFIVKKSNNETRIYGLSLNAGDVLLFEEILSPTTFNLSDIDPIT